MKTKQEPMLDKEIIISFLAKNRDKIATEYNIDKMALYGSYARNEAREDSDIDIVVQMTQADFTKLCLFKEFLENKFHKTISVTTFNGLRTYIKWQIEKDLIYA